LRRRGCTRNNVFIIGVLAIATSILASEGALADEPSRDASRDTSDENDADVVFQSIKPLESAIVPVSSENDSMHF